MMAHVDLCSGIGGFGYGFETVGLSKPVLFCEIDPWCRKVLKKHWPDVPIAEDVKELADDPDRYVPRNLDWSNTIVSGGYPCQAFSVAGKQKGWEDPRAIWPWLHKLVALKRPKFAVFENVVGHIALGLDKVIHDLEGENYSIATLIIPASSVGAPHKRERLWIVAKDMADTSSEGLEGGQQLRQHTKENGRGQEGAHGSVAQCCDDGARQTADSTAQPRMGHLASRLSKGLDRFGKHDGFEVEPSDIPRVASGIKDRANRLKGLGNAIVPQIAMQIGLAIKESQWK